VITLGQQQAQLAETLKRRKDHERRMADEVSGEPLTAAHAADEAAVAADCAGQGHCEDAPVTDAAAKAYQDAGATGGPAQGMPGQDVSPGRFRRGYEDPGHSAPSPQSGPPCDFPVPSGQPAPGDFGRHYLVAGHAAGSPANTAPQVQPLPPGLSATHGAGPAELGLAAHQPGVFVPTFPPHAGGPQSGGSAA
jgi:hypothetical protein